MDDEAYYLAVIEELKQGPPRPGLWLKAMTLSNGNESTARSQYITLRVDQLKNARRLKIFEKFATQCNKHFRILMTVLPKIFKVCLAFLFVIVILALISIFLANK